MFECYRGKNDLLSRIDSKLKLGFIALQELASERLKKCRFI